MSRDLAVLALLYTIVWIAALRLVANVLALECNMAAAKAKSRSIAKAATRSS